MTNSEVISILTKTLENNDYLIFSERLAIQIAISKLEESKE